MRRQREYQMPAAPNACAVCGRPYDLSRQSFRFGRRALDLPVCATCWKRHESARHLFVLAAGVAAVAAAVGVGAAVLTGHVEPVLAGAAVAALVLAPAALLRRSRRPKRLTGEGIVIEIPGCGSVRVG
jgi:hypothetical protein